MPKSTQNLLQNLAQNANVSFDHAQCLPRAIYHSSEFLELEHERLFRKDWICIGRTAEIPDRGDYLCREIVDTPILLIRQRDGSLKAFANACWPKAGDI